MTEARRQQQGVVLARPFLQGSCMSDWWWENLETRIWMPEARRKQERDFLMCFGLEIWSLQTNPTHLDAGCATEAGARLAGDAAHVDLPDVAQPQGVSRLLLYDQPAGACAEPHGCGNT